MTDTTPDTVPDTAPAPVTDAPAPATDAPADTGPTPAEQALAGRIAAYVDEVDDEGYLLRPWAQADAHEADAALDMAVRLAQDLQKRGFNINDERVQATVFDHLDRAMGHVDPAVLMTQRRLFNTLSQDRQMAILVQAAGGDLAEWHRLSYHQKRQAAAAAQRKVGDYGQVLRSRAAQETRAAILDGRVRPDTPLRPDDTRTATGPQVFDDGLTAQERTIARRMFGGSAVEAGKRYAAAKAATKGRKF